MVDVQGGGLSARKRFFPNSQFGLSYYLLKTRPKLGIQLPFAVDDYWSVGAKDSLLYSMIIYYLSPLVYFNIYEVT